MVSEAFGDLLLKIAVCFLFAVLNTFIFHHIVLLRKHDDIRHDKPLPVAITISVLLFLVSYLPKLKVLFSLIAMTIIPIALIKELYEINWKKAFMIWLYWFVFILVVSIIAGFIL